MADVVEGSNAPTVEQESRSFELPTEAAPTDPVDAPAPTAEDAVPPPPPADEAGSSSSSDDEEEKAEESTPIPPSDVLPSDATAPVAPAGRWSQLLDKVHPSVKKHAETVANHPYVTATANTLRQRAGQAQERMQPLVNHPYVQKGTGAIKAGGTKTMETGKKVYNREEGYEPKRLVPFFVATIGLVALGLLLRMLTQKYYPELGTALKLKLSKDHEL